MYGNLKKLNGEYPEPKRALSLWEKAELQNYSYTMYFGRDVIAKPEVTAGEFRCFVDDEIATRFYAFTITDGIGYWNGKQERTFIVEVIGNDDVHDRCKQICQAYCTWANQECVALKSTPIDPIHFIPATTK